tara:strand:- start:606 stop:1097 length:492 start_codon:yes stop_codon:yes gene_type:complete
MNNRSFKNDLAMGLEKELEVIDMLKLNWEDEVDIRNTKDIYGDDYYIYDFEAQSGTSWELKSRRIKKNQYSTTIVPVSKVRDTTKKQVFVFNFTDATCKIDYAKHLWDTFEIKNVTTFRLGKVDYPKPHYHIPVRLLEDLVRVHTIEPITFPPYDEEKFVPVY